ncbi:MAG: prevent-host-death family protein [Legionellales bacterium]|nr:MAG: prevent-host-death family protein [Legionellales bacterium]
MQTIPISNARSDLFNIANSITESHEPIMLTSKKGNIVMLAAEDFAAIQETLYIHSIPGLVNDIKNSRNDPDSEFCTRDELEW